MTPELTVLALAALLQVGADRARRRRMNRDVGVDVQRQPARQPQPQFSPLTGRLRRAVNNHFEALILFTIAVVVVTLSGAVEHR